MGKGGGKGGVVGLRDCRSGRRGETAELGGQVVVLGAELLGGFGEVGRFSTAEGLDVANEKSGGGRIAYESPVSCRLCCCLSISSTPSRIWSKDLDMCPS